LINCVKNQTWKNFEWVIIDDGTDSVGDLFENCGINNVRYIRMNDKMSIGAKRNMLCEISHGQYIVFMDDDDYYPPERIEHAIISLLENPAYSIAGTTQMYIYFTSLQKIIKFGPYSDNHCTAATMAMHSSFAKKHKFPNSSVGEETIFLNGYNEPILQLNPFKTILAFSHNQSSCDKNELLENLERNKGIKTDLTFADWGINESYEWISLINNYAMGNIENKPDIIIELLKNKNNRLQLEKDELCTQIHHLNIRVEQMKEYIKHVIKKNN
jgi:glycosyltransferase involved in cell wall biosynthesis